MLFGKLKAFETPNLIIVKIRAEVFEIKQTILCKISAARLAILFQRLLYRPS